MNIFRKTFFVFIATSSLYGMDRCPECQQPTYPWSVHIDSGLLKTSIVLSNPNAILKATVTPLRTTFTGVSTTNDLTARNNVCFFLDSKLFKTYLAVATPLPEREKALAILNKKSK